MNWFKYAPTAFIVVFIAVLLCALKYKKGVIADVNDQNHKLHTELIMTRQSLSSAREAVAMQNDRIAAYAIDKAEAEKRYHTKLAALRNKSSQARVEIVKELVRDPSCENELRLIKDQLEIFYEK